MTQLLRLIDTNVGGVVRTIHAALKFMIASGTGDIVVTNSNPRRFFDSAAIKAVGQWRYKPLTRDGKPAEQRVAVRIRFSDQ